MKLIKCNKLLPTRFHLKFTLKTLTKRNVWVKSWYFDLSANMATPAVFIVEQYSHFSCICWKGSYLSHTRLNIVIKYKYKRILVQVIKSSGLRVFRSSNAPWEHGIARRGAARRWWGLQDPVLILLRWWRAWQKTSASSVPIGTQIWGRKEALATGNLRPGCCYFCFFFFTRSASPLK